MFAESGSLATVAGHDSRPSTSSLLRALFAYSPRPHDGQRWRAAEIAERTRSGPHPVSESYLSQLCSGYTPNPGFAPIASLAQAFDVDVAFFTATFHRRHRGKSMKDRVAHARNYRGALFDTAVALASLPEHQRAAVLQVVDLLGPG